MNFKGSGIEELFDPKLNRRSFLKTLLVASLKFSDIRELLSFLSSPKFQNLVKQEQSEYCRVFDEMIANESWEAFLRNYEEFKNLFITSENTPDEAMLRVIRPENGNDTVSEGIGYGMIMAVNAGDREVFDGLFNFAQYYINKKSEQGRALLMPWKIDPEGNIDESVEGAINSATDSDFDIAYSLITAFYLWGEEKYKEAAQSMLEELLTNSIEQGTNIIKPGDVWGGSDVNNPSYFPPAYLDLFETFSGHYDWREVEAAYWEVISNIRATRSEEGQVVLWPNWTSADGSLAPEYMGDQRDIHGYDAVREAWRLAKEVIACGSENRKAYEELVLVNQHYENIFINKGIEGIVDGYSIYGEETGEWNNAPFVAEAAIASIVSSNRDYQSAIFQYLKNMENDGRYYNMALKTLALLLISGKMELELHQEQTQQIREG